MKYTLGKALDNLSSHGQQPLAIQNGDENQNLDLKHLESKQKDHVPDGAKSDGVKSSVKRTRNINDSPLVKNGYTPKTII